MQPITAVVEEAEVYKISQLFNRKPPGLAFNDTDALVIKARMQDGRQIGATFYFCMKPDGTFEEEALGRDGRYSLSVNSHLSPRWDLSFVCHPLL